MPSKDNALIMYVGCYTNKKEAAISVFRCDSSLDKPELVQQVTGIRNASFLAVDAEGGKLYAVSEVHETDGQPGGAVACYRIDPESGKLTEHGPRQLTHGNDPCYVIVDRHGAHGASLLVANYSGGSVARFPLRNEDGGLEPASQIIAHKGASLATDRQEAPHPHSVVMDPSGRYAVVPDLGRDKLVVYLNAPEQGGLVPHDETETDAGAGPRHFVFHPDQPRAYVINELNGTITAYDYDAGQGSLSPVQTVPVLPADFQGSNTCADLHLSPDGKFLYGSNRGHDSIAVFAVEPTYGRLTPIGHVPTRGRTPRNFGITPDGNFLVAANQESDNLVTFRIDRTNGMLEWTGQEIAVSEPVCVAFMTTNFLK
ncbi:lactonase family protein [Paenibacillus sp. H1-7]|uniref:lactonase family protein n=1 Tax=Paenibacillus sp. H1-7 TaxID=2282849 RepID=UPI001EF78D17|nr:lactonase family protein [Paenibacillus sp. H1-7]ULL15064.1 lactonase family protein [Paenibacillus sp. H1-7]